MLTIKPLGKASDALHYYSSKDNYYLKDKESLKSSSLWMGKGAEIQGLTGIVDNDVFLKLLNGELQDGQKLGVIRDGEREHRAGTDITLSAPKSVSILALALGDEKVLNAHLSAVKSTFNVIEKMAAEARITFNGETAFQKTKNLTAASFLHTSSRALDPDLHTHLVILNMTKRIDDAWRALASRSKNDKENLENGFREIIHQNQHYFGLVYMSTLAKEIKKLGFDIRIKDIHGNFEIEGVPQELIDQMSKRRDEILKDLNQKGLSGSRAAEVSNKALRKEKEDTDTQALIKKWQDEINDFGIDINTLLNLANEKQEGKTNIDTAGFDVSRNAKEAVDDALEHLSIFNTQVRHGTLVTHAFGFAKGTVSHDEIEQQITHLLEKKELAGKENQYYTSKKMVEREQLFKDRMSANKKTSIKVTSEQTSLAKELLNNKKNIDIIDVNGLTNQKDLIQDFVNLSDENKLNVYVLHQSKNHTQLLSSEVARQSHGRFYVWLKNLFKDEVVHTVAGFKYHHGKSVNATNKQSAIIVHDAQKLSLDDLENLKAIADSNDGKLILLNNMDSTNGYSAGNPIKTLKEHGVASTKALSARKKIQVEIAASKTADFHAVGDKVKAILLNKPKTLLAVSNEQKQTLNQSVRESLKKEGIISIQEKVVSTLTTKSLTSPEKKQTKFYSVGDRLTFKAFTKEQKHYEVVSIKGNSLILKNEKGTTSQFTPENVDDYLVSKKADICLSKGDIVKNDRALFINRQKFEKHTSFAVTKISSDGIRLEDVASKTTIKLSNDELSKTYLSHGYVKKTSELTKDDKNIILSAKAHQLSRNLIGEIGVYAKEIKLYTANKTKAKNFCSQEQLKWTAQDIADDKPSLIYRDLHNSNYIIKEDLTRLIESLDLDKSGFDKEKVAELAVSYALAKCAEKEAAFKHSDLMTYSLKYALGEIDHKDIEPVLKKRLQDGTLRYCDSYWTTKKSFELEKSIIAKNLSNQNILKPIECNKDKLLQLPSRLTQGQKDAISLICSSKDRFNSVQGLAGVGKTTMMKEVQKVAADNGFKVQGIGPTHRAKDELYDNQIHSDTVRSFLDNDTPIDSKTIVIADEASMLDNVTYHELQHKLEAANSRLFYAGDITQLQSKLSGIPHELTVKTKTQKTAFMNEMIRQNPNPTLKKAAEFSSEREIAKAFGELDKLAPSDWVSRKQDSEKYNTSVVEIASEESDGTIDNSKIYEAVAQDYLSREKECRDNTMILIPAHKDRLPIDNHIREGLKKENLIDKNDIPCMRLAAKNLDTADYTKINNFKKGDIIRFGKTYHIGSKGEYFKVESIDTDKNKMQIRNDNNLIFNINPKVLINARASIYEEQPSQLAIGDKIRLRLTNENNGFVANKEYFVKEIDEHTALIENDKQSLKINLTDKSTQHWDYAWTNTGHSLQGATSKYIIGLGLKESVLLTTHRLLEIIFTRPSHHLTMYTNDRAGLIERIDNPVKQRDADKKSAIMEVNRAKNKKIKERHITQNLIDRRKEDVTKAKENTTTNQLAFKENKIDANELHLALVANSETLSKHLLGEPNKSLSKQNTLRYGSKGSLSINLTKGVWYNFETEESGNLFQLIGQEKGLSDFKDILKFAQNFTNYTPGYTPQVKQKSTPVKDKNSNGMRKKALEYYGSSKPIKGSLVEKYLLVHRGITCGENADIRYCASVYTTTKNGKLYVPALLAFSKNKQGDINNAQVTKLDINTGNKCKKSEVDKQTYGANNGCLVNLNRKGNSDVTYITEGVETGLSIAESNPKARVFTVLGKSNFKNINASLVPTKKIILCVDNDGNNTYKYNNDRKNIIITSIENLEKKGFEVQISLPKIKGQDLNDILLSKGVKGVKKELLSLLKPDDFKAICDKNNNINSSTKSKEYSFNKTNLDNISDLNRQEISDIRVMNKLRKEYYSSKEIYSKIKNTQPEKSIIKVKELEREL